MEPIKIFISYRRDSDLGRSALVEKAIQGGFQRTESGIEVSIYRDVEQRLGVAWPEEIVRHVAGADLFLVLIGPEWLAATDNFSRRRIDQEDDWVRKEIALALEHKIETIPILFDDARMPPREALPSSIAELSERQGLPVRTESLDLDVQPLLLEIKSFHESTRAGTNARSPRSVGDGWPYPDPPLPVKPAQMSDQDIATALDELLDGWQLIESPLPEDPGKRRVELFHQFEFPTFGVALEFMNDAADFCERANHHPRWENIYRTVRIYLTSWDIGHRISHLDVILASHLDKLAIKYVGT